MAASTGLKGVNYTLNANPFPDSLRNAMFGGKVMAKVDSIAFDASNWDSGTTFYMGRLPKGCFVLGFQVYSGAMTNAVTMSIGDGSTAARFGAITTLASASKQTIPCTDPTTEIVTETDILITTGGANCGATGTFILITYLLVPENWTV